MHAGAVRVDGEKMSKSLGNFFTIREILDKYDAEVVRYLLISSHYRSEIDYSQESLQEARNGLDRFYNALKDYADVVPASQEEMTTSSYFDRFIIAMDDDFNTREALSVMYDLVRELNSAPDVFTKQNLAGQLKALGQMLGILLRNPLEYLQAGVVLNPEQIDALIAERLQARANKNFARSDEIRDELKAKGIVLEDGKGGTTWRRE
jgi:cysteinyl-tRNA synthetase